MIISYLWLLAAEKRGRALFRSAKNLIREQLISRRTWIGEGTRGSNVASLIADLRPKFNKNGLRRFGPAGDGGYLMPDDLEGVRACVSPGVSTEVGFDLEIADRGIDVYLADASVSGPPIEHARFHFTRKFFDIYNSDTTTTINDFCGGIQDSDDLILEMDIEGAEYRVLASAAEETMRRFRAMVIEFHDLDYLFSRVAFREFSAVFSKLRRTHEVVHIHPNNGATALRCGELRIPKLLEFTFYRNDRGTFEQKPLQFPHPLDTGNFPDMTPLVLPKCWYLKD